jgi:hypothetical protein
MTIDRSGSGREQLTEHTIIPNAPLTLTIIIFLNSVAGLSNNPIPILKSPDQLFGGSISDP